MTTFKKQKFNKKGSLNLGGIICLTTAVYFIYYLLVQHILPGSVHSLLSWNSGSAKKWHVLAIGLVPIYLSLIIFGTASFSLYVGSSLQRWLTHLRKIK
ncbi:MAG: hypothetical protein V4501_00345 [Pseudomonadota bacterium]